MNKKQFSTALLKYIPLVFLSVVFAFPFFWMLSAASNKSVDIIKGKIIPGTFLLDNITNLLNTVSLGAAFMNSARNSILATLLSLFICSMAGYGFQIYRDKAKDRLMSVLLLSMMVPFASIMIPLFRMFSQANLLNTTVGFILPSISTAFLIFFFRQSSASFPMEIVQAARVDGLSEFGIFARIYVPVMMPTFAAAAIITFMSSWNNYLWSLIVLQQQESQTMPLLLASLTAGYTTDYGILMLAVAICTLPTLLVFVTQQRRFISGILGSIK
jgi:lactose/L-arabinose transport system permease protein